MLGTIVNNKQLIQLVQAGRIKITPFKESQIKTIHYPLRASRFLECGPRNGGDPTFKTFCEFSNVVKEVQFQGQQYLIAQIKETISVDDGIIGHFVPSSKLIDYGFDLTCGRLEAPYGANGEVIRFGVTNKLDRINTLLIDDVIGYVYFIDLRALSNIKVELPPEERKLFERWKRWERDADSGVAYDD